MARSAVWMAVGVSLAICTRESPAVAQLPVPAPKASWVEAGGFHHHVSNGFGDWTGGYARLVLAGTHNVWYADAKYQEAFHDRGAYGSLANVHTFSSRLYTQAGVAAGTGRYVLPRLRLDGSLNLKFGPARSLILSAGGTYVKSKSIYHDLAVFGSLFWYAGGSLLLEAGGRVNWSDPGTVRTERVNGSITLGRVGATVLTARGSTGWEGYQLVGVPVTLQRFRSQEATLSWRQWLSARFGTVLGGEWYHNNYYTRAGASLGIFGAW